MGAVEQLSKMLADCSLCPRMCHVNRVQGEKGFCGVGSRAVVASAGPHFGEERPLVGAGGSGTIFFAGCNLGCVFCQNYDISHGRAGEAWGARQLAAAMLHLQERGCHNINFVTPSHVAPQIVEALELARMNGLTAPTVYNCGGYDRVETLQIAEGYFDIYMPDAKYLDVRAAKELSGAEDYPEVMAAALKEMHRQVGDLEIVDGIARRGLLVRHLVMPGGVADSIRIIDFLADEISADTFVNVMDQYRPAFRAREYPRISRRLARAEHLQVVVHARDRGLRISD